MDGSFSEDLEGCLINHRRNLAPAGRLANHGLELQVVKIESYFTDYMACTKRLCRFIAYTTGRRSLSPLSFRWSVQDFTWCRSPSRTSHMTNGPSTWHVSRRCQTPLGTWFLASQQMSQHVWNSHGICMGILGYLYLLSTFEPTMGQTFEVPQPTDGWIIFRAGETFTFVSVPNFCPMPQCSWCPYGIVSICCIFDLIWYVDMLTWFAKSSKKHPKYIQLFHFRIGSSGTAGQRWPKWPTVGSQLPAGHPTWNDHSTISKRSAWTASVVEMDIGVQLSNVTCYLTWSDVLWMTLLRRRRVPAPVTRRWRSTATFGSALWGISLPHRPVGSVSLAPVTIPGAPTSAALMRRRVLGCSRQRSVDVGMMLNNVFKDGKCSILEMDYLDYYVFSFNLS